MHDEAVRLFDQLVSFFQIHPGEVRRVALVAGLVCPFVRETPNSHVANTLIQNLITILASSPRSGLVYSLVLRLDLPSNLHTLAGHYQVLFRLVALLGPTPQATIEQLTQSCPGEHSPRSVPFHPLRPAASTNCSPLRSTGTFRPVVLQVGLRREQTGRPPWRGWRKPNLRRRATSRPGTMPNGRRSAFYRFASRLTDSRDQEHTPLAAREVPQEGD